MLLVASITAARATAPFGSCPPAWPRLVVELATVYEAVSGHGVLLSPTASGTPAALRPYQPVEQCLDEQARRPAVRANPVAWEALVVAVHTGNRARQNLALEELRRVFTGEIVNWRQLGGDDLPLELLVPGDRDMPASRAISRRLFGHVERPLVAAGVYDSPAIIAEAVSTNPGAIAVLPLSLARHAGLRALSLEGAHPGHETVSSGEYSLVYPVYVTYPVRGPGRGSAGALLEFAHSQAGRQVIRKLGAAPYLEALHLAHHHRYDAVADAHDQPPERH